jgi:MoxR-like ATPase
MTSLTDLRARAESILAEVEKAIVGKRGPLELILLALLADGHVLLEDYPGLAKTLIARSFAQATSLRFARIQFTPDLMPGDVTGSQIFDQRTTEFVFRPGPIFANLLLADEINRAPPKTQAALLQAMNERIVTIDGHDYSLGEDFMVIATQNPIEQQGTYPLPEAQLDRFLFKIVIGHPGRDEEREIVRRHGHRSAMPRLEDFGLKAIAGSAVLAAVRDEVMRIRLSDELMDYIVDVIRGTREHASLDVGASTRAANMLAAAARAFAALNGRDFVIPDDVKILALPVLRHRVILSASAEIEGLSTDRVVSEILDRTAAPR